MIRTYFAKLIEEEMPGAAGKMKQFASWFTHGVPNGSHLRHAIYQAHTEREILARVEEFFEGRMELRPDVVTTEPDPWSVARCS
jgi:hypothetical protein